MTNRNLSELIIKKLMIIATLLLWISVSSTPVFSHGGKHTADEFTHLQALQKATELYDRLIASGKLDQSWETTLVRVEVSNRQKGNKKGNCGLLSTGRGRTAGRLRIFQR